MLGVMIWILIFDYFLQVDTDFCNPNPCAHRAACYNTAGDYYCDCAEGWGGKNCTEPPDKCRQPPCYGKHTHIPSFFAHLQSLNPKHSTPLKLSFVKWC